MDHFRSLYKANPTTTTPKKCKWKEVHEFRTKKRNQLYTSTRNISPTLSSSHCSSKENVKPLDYSEAEKLPRTESSGSPNSKIDQKLTRQKAHILKFLAWKAEKAKQAQIKETSKRAPFIVGTRNYPATASGLSNCIKQPSFAPTNHIFRPPATIQNLELKVIDSNSVLLINGTRKETYHFLDTPKKKNKLENGISAIKSYKKTTPRPAIEKPTSDKTCVVTTKVTKLPLNSKPMLETGANMEELPAKRKGNSKAILKPKTVLPPIKRTTFKPPKKCNSSISNAFIPVTRSTHFRGGTSTSKVYAKSVLNDLAGAENQPKHISETPSYANEMNPSTNELISTKINSHSKVSAMKSFKMNNLVHGKHESKTQQADGHTKQMPVPKGVIVTTVSGKTTIAKAPFNPKPKLNTKVNTQQVPPKSKVNTDLLKAKSGFPPIKRPTFKAPKKSSSLISNAFVAVTGNTFRRGAPTVKLNGKSIQKTLAEVGKPSEQIPETPTDGIQAYPFLNVVTSTKRKSLSSKESSSNSLFVEMDQLVSPVDDATAYPVDGEKFNFLRYSIVQSNGSKLEGENKIKATDEIHVTPDKATGQPTTYLSPFVSVSRGKVGKKIEREKRNSVYMSMESSVQEDADTTAKARHTMATVHYYRKQLDDEIARLNDQCDAWQQYKEDNVVLVEDAGSDMINVTIGQTKLLITKKLKQFGDLIDRCENGAMGKKSLGKGDGAKPILTEDLEGFWSMVGLQIENVDKRFANLQRWKENNWKDPDEVPVKSTNSKSNLKKMKKLKPGSTAGPNRDLQKILKNAQTAFLRKKTANGGFDEDVILTPSSRQVLIRDRRSRSAAATVITVHTPRVKRKSFVFDQTTPTGIIENSKMLPHIHGFRKSMNLLNTLLIKQEKKCPEAINCATPLPLSSKSILKTPGSVRPPKNVIFNSPTLQFTVEDEVEDKSSSQSTSPSNQQKEGEEERTYSLRTRNIKLRDLADIVIPE